MACLGATGRCFSNACELCVWLKLNRQTDFALTHGIHDMFPEIKLASFTQSDVHQKQANMKYRKRKWFNSNVTEAYIYEKKTAKTKRGRPLLKIRIPAHVSEACQPSHDMTLMHLGDEICPDFGMLPLRRHNPKHAIPGKRSEKDKSKESSNETPSKHQSTAEKGHTEMGIDTESPDREEVPLSELMAGKPFAYEEMTPLPVRKLRKFLKLYYLCTTVTWADKYSKPMEDIEKMMVRSCIAFVVGDHGTSKGILESMINPDQSILGDIVHMLTNTSRQNAKTETAGRMGACLALASDSNDDQFLLIFAQNQDTSGSMLNRIKKYMKWLGQERNREIHKYDFSIGICNTQQLGIRKPDFHNQYEVYNVITAESGSPDSNRGVAPCIVIGDEFGFWDPKMLTSIILPLFNVPSRRAFFFTTPGYDRSDWYYQFVDGIRKRRKENKYSWIYIDYNLACSFCCTRGKPIECCHNLHYMHPVKSYEQVFTAGDFISEAQKINFEMENFGVRASSVHSLFRETAVTFLTQNKKENLLMSAPIQRDVARGYFINKITDEKICKLKTCVFVVIDPPSHESSCMGIMACIMGFKHQMIVIGLSEVLTDRIASLGLWQVIGNFLIGLRQHPLVHAQSPFVPIIECNHRDLDARDFIMYVFDAIDAQSMNRKKKYGPYIMPFTRSNKFDKHIAEDLGVYTNPFTKEAAVQRTKYSLDQRAVILSENIVTTSKACVDPAIYEDTTAQTEINMLEKGLLNYRYEKGKYHGKVAGANDDLATAFILSRYWVERVMPLYPEFFD